VLAIARRDLAMELSGRRGWVLPAVMAILLGPAAALPLPTRAPARVVVSGDVPAEVASLPGVDVGEGGTSFEREPDGTLVVRGRIGPAVRAALDGDRPAVPVAWVERSIPVPQRTLLLALIASSTLTGAIAASIPGERSARTMSSLLAAAVSRVEIAAGKWLAWGGLGAVASLAAALVAVAFGRVAAGSWLLAIPWVPLGTVAFGLWLVRRAGDPLAGTTASIRAVPAVLGAAGLLSWGLGLAHPLLGAIIPVGGALLAAGQTWGPRWDVVAVAVASSAVACAVSIAATARDLEETPTPAPRSPTGEALAALITGAAVTWPVVAFPVLWWHAGDLSVVSKFDPALPVWAAGALGLWAAAIARAREPIAPSRPAFISVLPGLAVGVALALGAGASALLPTPDTSWLAALREGARALLVPGWAGIPASLLLICADELFWRGAVQRRIGPGRTAIAWSLARAPLDPIIGLGSGFLLGAVAERGVAGAIAARLAWAALAGVSATAPWSSALFLAIALVAAFALRRR
jgi:hypothetical protein